MTGPTGPIEAPAASFKGERRRRVDLSDLVPRVLSGIVLVGVAAGTALAGGPSFALLWWLAALAIHWEWQRLLCAGRDAGRLIAGAAAITIAVLANLSGHDVWTLPVLIAGALATGLLGRNLPLTSGAGVVYAGLLPLALLNLRNSDSRGLEAVLWLFAVVWGTDIMAYFGGRLIGGPKLWRRVSPSKTWSGFLVGIGSGSLAGLAVSTGWGAHWPLLPLGLLAGIVAQAGDLFESSLKRRFGVKDSSWLIPGHGGVMDRLDGFLAAAVFGAGFGLLREGVHASAAGLMTW
ncbi:phosphatidate cytidylyltransferase [Lichenifustis flavocetrariae]|uniref:Phosphatidate cytidylyltransferase n=1 Tax=Lichenifustis flavocetrariae TaxID=2949735 RepID=A0AA41Z6Y4_9HYPH|nr:phosphatidate cytidylyltransferase [Lichenifustis flavocetrariae]MCW6510392.1 phosphatidate cytidylyltransferase [Lichenifustis flavocetrariae]